jgi:large subunit ribosomal protein L2
MPVKKFNPITPGTRFRIGNTFAEVTTTDKPERSLVTSTKRTGGRNHDGKMTVRNRGGGHKKKYRVIDFNRDKDGIPGTVKSI